MSSIQNYSISLTSSFSFYTSKQPLCNKTASAPLTFNSQKDIWFCFDQYNLLECNAQWSLILTCGTFLEIHKPFNPQFLRRINLADVAWIKDSNGISITNVVVKGLCAGLYHVWFVYYSRAGQFVRAVRTIFIAYPSCPCWSMICLELIVEKREI